MILIYTGPGKGKTCACVGQALRALGHDLNVWFGQFIKRDQISGEQKILAHLLGKRFFTSGLGFVRSAQQKELHCQAARSVFEWGLAAMHSADMLVLDESIYALNFALLTNRDMEQLLIQAGSCKTHLILSGRNAPDWLIEAADLVTTLVPSKHPHASGAGAVEGIEY